MDDELKQWIERTAAETRQHADGLAAETQRYFGVTAERLRSAIDLLGEGVTIANERIDRIDTKIDRLETKLEAEFADVRSMIKFSHHELDRRLRSLEEIVADLQNRVERLESSAH